MGRRERRKIKKRKKRNAWSGLREDTLKRLGEKLGNSLKTEAVLFVA